MNLDISKTSKTPNDGFQAVEYLCESQQNLIDALHILNSVIEYSTEEYKDIHKKKIEYFIKRFEK